MPLLGKKIFAPSKPLKDIQPSETVFTIPYTGEKFRFKSDYEKRCNLYKEKIWTCQCTGHVNLSYEEAWNSEKSVQKTIKEQFVECFEKPTLEVVHHATVCLDSLVVQAWLKVQQVLNVGEKVILKVKAAGRVIKGKVVMVDTTGVNANPTSNCSSPSSDKENSSTDSKDTNNLKKWLPPKLLPYKYSIRLEGEDKVINAVPASDLSRSERPPSKDLLRLFIRANTVRAGQTPTSPWVVNEEMVQKYKLPSKFADFLLSPAKLTEASLRVAEEMRRKRKSSKSQDRQSKKQKLDKDSKKRNGKVKKSPKKGMIEIINSDSSSDDEIVLSKVIRKSICKTDDSDSPHSDFPLVKIKSSKSRRNSSDSNSDSEDEPLSKLGSCDKKSFKKKKSKSSSKSSKKSDDKKSKNRPKKREEKEKKKKNKKSKDKEKGLKQMTLFELASKKGKTSPSKSTPRKLISQTVNITPPIVTQLVKAQKLEDQSKFQVLVKKAAATLTATQRNNLPKTVKEAVMKKFEIIREKQLLAKMTPAEREEYFKKKRLARKAELSKRFEDQSLKLTPLPTPKLVTIPDTLPNEMFGDVAMVTELISSYKGLLMPNDDYPIYSDALMKALCTGPQGFAYLSRVLAILLQTLLQDQIAESYTELKAKLADIPVNPFTVSELVRLCLRSNDAGQEVNEEEEEEDVDVAQYIIEKLEDKEFYQLEPSDKLAILKGLCLRIMGSYSVQDFMEEKQVQATKLTKQKYVEQRELNEKLKKDKDKQSSMEGGSKLDGSSKSEGGSKEPTLCNLPTTQNTAGLITAFYGNVDKTDSDGSTAAEPSGPVENDDDDLVSTIRSRRVNAAKVASEKAKREEEKRKLIAKNIAEYKRQKEKENFEKAFKDGIEAAKQALRIVPIGSDRNHDRYWIFTYTTPGLYIERGWVTQDYAYNVRSDVSEDDELINKLCTPKKQNGTTNLKVTPSKSLKKIPSTSPSVPHFGQNLWFEYDSVKDLDQLIEALHPQGMRESSLKSEIKKRYEDINKAINISRRTNLELRDSDGDVEIIAGIRREILEMEIRLRNGGLGGVSNFTVWESQVLSAEKLEDFSEFLLDVEANVLEKFFKGFMRRKTLALPQSSTTKVEIKDDNSDEDEDEDDEEKDGRLETHKHRDNWREAVRNCFTFSRFHVLMGMLESCIRWEKSAENAKCKICRKKDNDDRLLLCDECNQAFHMYCLRPALQDIPKDDWFCAACAPSRRPTQIIRRFCYEHHSRIAGDETIGAIEHEENCAECGGDEDLIQCSECPLVYHTFCHDPQLRHPPRGHWECMDCKSGGRRKKKKGAKSLSTNRRPRSKGRGGINYADHDSDEEFTIEYKPTKKFKPTASKRTGSKTRPQPIEPDDSPPRMSRRAPSELSLCEDILNQLVKQECSWPFAEAVNKKAVPDYYSIIKHPMDFRTMRNKLIVYSSAQEFIEDLSLVFRNTAQYNTEDSDIYKCMITMEKLAGQLVSSYLPNHIYSRDVVTNGYDDHGYSSKRKRR